MVYHIDIAYIEESLHPSDKPKLMMVYEVFNVLLESVWILLRIFASVLISGTGLWLFLCCLCLIFSVFFISVAVLYSFFVGYIF